MKRNPKSEKNEAKSKYICTKENKLNNEKYGKGKDRLKIKNLKGGFLC